MLNIFNAIALVLATIIGSATATSPATKRNAASTSLIAIAQKRAKLKRSTQQVKFVTTFRQYGLVLLEDENTSVQQVYKSRGVDWTYIGGGGGSMNANEMYTLYHVPISIGVVLVSRLRADLTTKR